MASPREARSTQAVPEQPPLPTSSLLEGAVEWREVLDRFCAHSDAVSQAFQLIAGTGCSEHQFLGPICAASALDAYGLLPATGATLHLAILGAEKLDHGIDGRLYGLLPRLLARADLKVEVELVGPEYQVVSKSKSLDRLGLQAATAYRVTCGEWLKSRPSNKPLPDVVFLFHPGLETHARRWLAPGELSQLLRLGKPVIIFAYDDDEAERDAYVLRAHGVQVTEPKACAFGFEERTGIKEAPLFTFAQAMILARGYGDTDDLNEKVIGQIENLSKALSEVFMEENRKERHVDAFRHYPIWRGRELRAVAHVFGRVYYDVERKELFVGEHGRELDGLSNGPIENAQLEAACRGEFSPVQRAIIATAFFRLLRG